MSKVIAPKTQAAVLLHVGLGLRFAVTTTNEAKAVHALVLAGKVKLYRNPPNWAHRPFEAVALDFTPQPMPTHGTMQPATAAQLAAAWLV